MRWRHKCRLTSAVAPDGQPADLGGAAAPLFVAADGKEPTVRSIHRLRDDLRLSLPGAPLRLTLADIAGQPTTTLIRQLATATDPLPLWALHAELTRREVPPCQRWPGSRDDEQSEFITWVADLSWFARHHPDHQPGYRGWRGIFIHPLGSDAWHATAHRQFVFVRARYGLAHWCSKGLALSDSDRADLMTLPTKKMTADRRQLGPAAADDLRLALLDDAQAHPDRSGQRQPHAIADRRARLWQTYILAGRSATETARCWALITGVAISRQAVAKQTDAIQRAIVAHRRAGTG